MATTTTTFNLELYKTKSDDEALNKCILNLIELLDKYQKKYPDNFPVNADVTGFTIEGEELTKWLTKFLKTASAAAPALRSAP